MIEDEVPPTRQELAGPTGLAPAGLINLFLGGTVNRRASELRWLITNCLSCPIVDFFRVAGTEPVPLYGQRRLQVNQLACLFFDLPHGRLGNGFIVFGLPLRPGPVLVPGTVYQEDFDIRGLQRSTRRCVLGLLHGSPNQGSCGPD